MTKWGKARRPFDDTFRISIETRDPEPYVVLDVRGNVHNIEIAMHPDEARELAALLVAAATQAEVKP